MKVFSVGDILNDYDLRGITRKDLEWWENKGYVSPRKVKHGRRFRREYTDEDLQKIRLMWKYRQEGFPPAVAHSLAKGDLESLEILEDGKSESAEETSLAILQSPRVGSPSSGTKIVTSVLDKGRKTLTAIFLKEKPDIIIAISGFACLAAGTVFSKKFANLNDVIVIPIEQKDSHILRFTLHKLDPENKVLVLHDGSSTIKSVLEVFSRQKTFERLIEVTLHAPQ